MTPSGRRSWRCRLALAARLIRRRGRRTPRRRPQGLNWEIKAAARPQGQKQTNRGSWREEIRQGKCLTLKEKSATGEYKETRTCN